MKNIKIKSNKNQQKGEIVTVVTLGSLLIIGVASLLSSVFLQKPNTTNTKAQTVNDSKCPGKMDVSGACNPACCSRDTDSSNPDINCPSGQTCTHANGYCTGGSLGQFSCEPKGSKGKSICTQNQCSWILCNPNDSSCCDSQSDPRCQLCNSNDECVGVNPAPPITNGNQCFSLSAKVSQEPITGGIKFITNTIITNKARIGAHIQMWVNGNQTLFNNYNKINEGTINYEVGGEYSGSPIIVMKGESATITYRVKEDECNNLGNEDSLTCTFSVDNVGNPYSSCGLTNPPAKISGSSPNGGTSTVTTPGTTGDITTFPKCDQKKPNDCVGFGGTIFVDDKEFTPLTNDEFVQIKVLSKVSNYEKILPNIKSSTWSWMDEAKSGASYYFLAILKRGNTVISNPDDTVANKTGPNLNLNFHLSRNGTSTGTYTTGILQSFTMIGSISSGNIDDFDFSPLIFDKNNNYQSVKVVSKKSLNSNPKLFQITGTIDNFIDKNAPFKCQMYIYKTGTNIDVQPDTPPQISDCKLTNGFANDFGKINITVAPAQVLGTTQPFTIKGSLSSGSVSDYDFSLLISDNNNNNPSVKVIKTEMINNNPKLFLLTGTVDNYFEKNAPYNCQLYVYLKNGNVEVQPNPPPERSNCKLSPGYTIDFGIIVIKTSPPPANPIQTFKIRAIITDNMAGRSWNTLTKKVTIEDENGDAANITSQSPYVEQDLKQITTTVSINNFDATHTYTCKMQILDGTTILNTSIPTITPCRLAGINMTSFDLKDTTPSSAPPAPTQQVYFTVDVNVKNTEVVDKRLQYNQLNVKVAIIDPSGNEVVSQAKDLTGNVEDINIKSFDFTNITILKSDVSKNFTCLIRTKNIRDNSPFSYDPSSFVCKPNTVTGPLTISFNATDPDKLKLGTMKIVGRLKPKSGVPNDLLNFVKKDWNFIAAVYETNKTTRKTVDLTKNTLVHQYEDMGIYEFACSSDNEYRISNVIFNFSEMKSAGSARGISVPYMDGKTYQCNGVSLGWELDVFPNM